MTITAKIETGAIATFAHFAGEIDGQTFTGIAMVNGSDFAPRTKVEYRIGGDDAAWKVARRNSKIHAAMQAALV